MNSCEAVNSLSVTVFWTVVPCNMIKVLVFLITEAAKTYEKSVILYHATWRNITKVSYLHTGHRENLKPHRNVSLLP